MNDTTPAAATRVARELAVRGYTPSDGRTLEPWDRVFFGRPAPAPAAARPCVCGGELAYRDRDAVYLCGQWECRSCPRLFAATVAETVGALRKLLADARGGSPPAASAANPGARP